MPVDPRQPVLVGLGELTHRPDEGPAPEPAELAARAVRAAVADARAGDALLRRAQVLAMAPSAAWTDGDPARRVAELLGLGPGVRTARSSMQGGNGPLLLVNELAGRIAAGGLDAAIVCSGEALFTVAQHLKRGEAPPWPAADGARAPGEALEEERAAGTDAEAEAGVIAPLMAYPLIENALRAAAGRTPIEQLDRIAGLWSRFSAVAAEHPHAWSPHVRTREELATPSAENRRVTLPYLKLLNANIQVDQAAAVVLCSVEAARALGVPPDRWVPLHAGARAADEWHLSHRRDLARSPAIAACGAAAFGHLGIGPDDLGPVDLYSCFPSAVQLGADALGLSLEGELTCTGGLTFFGGPGNGYATHGLIAVARRLRAAPPGTRGLATALGWYATKHALTVLGTEPAGVPFAALAPEVERPVPREVASPEDAAAAGGAAVAETATLVYERDGSPGMGLLFALLPDGRRALGRTHDADVMRAIEDDGFLGSRVALRADRTFAPA